MIKAVFVDYTGTLMKEKCNYSMALAKLIAENSSLKDMREIFQIWWSLIKRFEEESYQESYITEDEILDKAVEALVKEYDFQADMEQVRELAHLFWTKAPIFEDVKEFFEKCSLPIYVITNNSTEYVKVFMEENELNYAGIICGDMVRAYKPHREIFEKALEVSGCRPEEVVHIGDSVSSDVKGAMAAGITPWLLDREQTRVSGQYKVCASLTEALEYL